MPAFGGVGVGGQRPGLGLATLLVLMGNQQRRVLAAQTSALKRVRLPAFVVIIASFV